MKTGDDVSSNNLIPRMCFSDVMKMCVLPMVSLPILDYSESKFLYRYLAERHGTRLAVTAVHTEEEILLFKKMLIEEKKRALQA
jgi:hypothetical protein